jgi:hypothetical protein
MYKLRLLFVLTVFSIITVSCEKDKGSNGTSVRDKFLVDKIYDYDDNLLAEYIYDNNNRLIKAIVTNLQNGTDELKFEYENGRVSKIIRYYGYQKSFFDHEPYEIHVFYNSQGQLIRTESHIGTFTMSDDYLYENGRVVSIYSEDLYYDVDTLFYDKSMNVTKRIRVFSDLLFENLITEDPVIGGTDLMATYYFKYDNRSKPNIGLDYLFIYDPLPVSIGFLERNLSKNNMTEFTLESGGYVGKSFWTYTYNENGLPSTIEIKYENIETLEPVFFRITYKQIE